MYGFCVVWVCECMDFVMYGLCVCMGFVLCECVYVFFIYIIYLQHAPLLQ